MFSAMEISIQDFRVCKSTFRQDDKIFDKWNGSAIAMDPVIFGLILTAESSKLGRTSQDVCHVFQPLFENPAMTALSAGKPKM